MRPLRRLMPAALLAAATVLGACSDSLSPEDVDPEQLSANLDDVTTTFANNIAFQSLRQLSVSFPSYIAVAALRATLPEAPRPGAWQGTAAARLRQTRVYASARAPGDILTLFPPDVLGKTFEWDVATHAYVAGTRTGAPANGIRLLLYAVNPVTGTPVEAPLQELGSLDLTDESSPQADKLGIVLRLAQTVVADYDITGSFGITVASLGAQGYIQRPDGTGRITFNLQNTLNIAQGTLALAYDINATDGTSIRIELSGNDQQATLVFRVGRGGNTLEISGTETQTAVDAVIKYNGVVVATVTGNPDDPTIAGANGHVVTEEELLALKHIVERVADFLEDFVEGIFGPADVVFGL